LMFSDDPFDGSKGSSENKISRRLTAPHPNHE
jgi:hypothetical protein